VKICYNIKGRDSDCNTKAISLNRFPAIIIKAVTKGGSTMNEVWKNIVGYEGKYQVSSFGQVRSIDRIDASGKKRKGRLLKPCKDKDGYLYVGLSDGGVTIRRIHKLVAEAFIGSCPNGHQVNHKDENKTNNRIENLEYVTAKQNINYGTGIKRRAEKRGSAVCQLSKSGDVIAKYRSLREAAKETGIDFRNIRKCCIGEKYYKTAGGYIWKYERA